MIHKRIPSPANPLILPTENDEHFLRLCIIVLPRDPGHPSNRDCCLLGSQVYVAESHLLAMSSTQQAAKHALPWPIYTSTPQGSSHRPGWGEITRLSGTSQWLLRVAPFQPVSIQSINLLKKENLSTPHLLREGSK